MTQQNVIFFDFDGVIADSLQIAFEVNYMLNPTLTLDRYRAYFNGNINNAKHEDEVVNEVDFFKEYGKRFEKLGIDDQKKAIIQKLAQKFRLFIISSTKSDIIQLYLKKHEILSCFTEILGNEIHPSKVKKFQMLFEKYNINPKNVVFITDSSGDMKEAKEAGIQKVVGILGGYQIENSLMKENPTLIVKDLPSFYDFVQKQLK